ncbi:MAG TPA: hypothetical protein VGV35_07955 [Bryobacteraceae bacterium]|nr:hypothetical protein [Bryobacteraceae bacterium]
MALFTDGPINGTVELQNYENAILDIAAAEGIDLAGKGALAQQEIATEVTLFLMRRFPPQEYPLASPTRQKVGVSDVVVTEPLRRWHAQKTLALVYRDAYNNQLNDRYQGKWNEYEELAKNSSRNYFQIGVGLVAGPVPKAATPTLTTAPGVGTGATFYVAAAWKNQAGQEGSPSDLAEITTNAGQQLVVDAGSPPAGVSGWNAYVGNAPATVRLQNSSPIAIGSTWTMISGLATGPGPGQGQQPTWFLVDQRVIERG